MGDKKQKTSKGYEIPTPKRSDFEKVLDAVVKPKKSRPRRPKK